MPNPADGLPADVPFVPLLAEVPRRVRRLCTLHLCRYLRAASGKDSALPPKRTKSLVDHLVKVLRAYSYNVYPLLKTSDDWTLPRYLFPIPSPPFPERMFPPDGILIKSHRRAPFFFGWHPLANLRKHDPAAAVVALNAALAQAAAAFDLAISPDLLPVLDQCNVPAELHPPLSSSTELRQALVLMDWALGDPCLVPDPSTLALWRHLSEASSRAARLLGLSALERYGEPVSLLAVEEAIDYMTMEERLPAALKFFARGRRHHRVAIHERAAGWERLCERTARILHGPEKVLCKPYLVNGGIPDIVIADETLQRDEHSRIIHARRIIDAKTGHDATVRQYAPFATSVESWHLHDAPRLARLVRRQGDEALAEDLLIFARRHLGLELRRLLELREELLT